MKTKFIVLTLIFSYTMLFAQEIVVNLNEKPVTNGFADLAKLKYNTKKIVEIDDATYPDMIKKSKAFISAVQGGNKTVILSGDVDLSFGKVTDEDHSYFDMFYPDSHGRMNGDFRYPLGSNLTLIGKDNARVKFGGFYINDGGNIIIRNIVFWDAHGSAEKDTKFFLDSKASADALTIGNSSGDSYPSGIWIDHCTFTDGTCDDMRRNYNHDGSLDIPKGINVTVSYCEFTNHDKVMLVGSSDKMTSQTERTLTLHHNYFHHTTQRTPRSRGCQIHLYNNYYDDIGVTGNGGYMFGPGVASLYALEGNYLGSHVGVIIDFYDGAARKDNSLRAKVYDNENSEPIKPLIHNPVNVSETLPFKIKYDYKFSPASDAKSDVLKNAGAGKTIEIIK